MRCIKLGMKMAVFALKLAELETLAEEIRTQKGEIEILAVNVVNYDALGCVFKTVHHKWRDIDLLITCIGTNCSTLFEDVKKEEIDTVIDVNLKEMIYATRQVLPHMSRTGSGIVINISSMVATRGINVPNNSNGIYGKQRRSERFLGQYRKISA